MSRPLAVLGCGDCGRRGERRGHMGCPYPGAVEDAADQVTLLICHRCDNVLEPEELDDYTGGEQVCDDCVQQREDDRLVRRAEAGWGE